MVRKIKLGKREINDNSLPYIIAEIGVNHEGSIDKAKEMILQIKEGGGDAAKFQSYKAEKIASKNSPYYWDLSKEPTKSQFELFKKYDKFGEKEYIELAEFCKLNEIDFLSTPFDNDAVEFLFPLVPFYKIASADITNIPFLRKISNTGKPVVLSTGASNKEEIEVAVKELINNGCGNLALLHCVLNYPTPDYNANLNMIIGMKEIFPDLIIGYSDHTLPDYAMIPLVTAYLKGAMILEKHFTFDKNLEGNDHYHAMDIDDLKVLVNQLKKISVLEGETEKNFIKEEEISRMNARRSIVTNRYIRKGEIITEDMIIPKRPAHGISPLFWDDVIGKQVARDLKEDHIFQWSDIVD